MIIFFWAACIIALTGNVYTKEKDASGNLKTWGLANRIVALPLLILSMAGTGYMVFLKGTVFAMEQNDLGTCHARGVRKDEQYASGEPIFRVIRASLILRSTTCAWCTWA